MIKPFPKKDEKHERKAPSEKDSTLTRKEFASTEVESFSEGRQSNFDTVVSPESVPVSLCQPRWLSWMRRPTGDHEVADSTPAEVGNILLWRLIVKYFLWSFPPFC